MKNTWMWVVLLFAFAKAATAQVYMDRSIIRLDDGSVYIGTILEDDEIFYKVLLSTGDTIHVAQDDIKRENQAEDIMVYENGKFHEISGFYWNVLYGFNGANITGDDLVSAHIETSLGYRFNEKFTVSGGMGIETNETRLSGFTFRTEFLSLFGRARYYPFKSKKRPFLFSRVGYGFSPQAGDLVQGRNFQSGGMNFENGIGIHFASRKKYRWFVSLGQYMQKTNGGTLFLDSFGNEIQTNYDIWINRMIVKVGIEFR